MRFLKYTILALFILGAILSYIAYQWIYSPNMAITDSTFVQIPRESNFEDVLQILDRENILKNRSSFTRVAQLMKYPNRIQSGNYKIEKDFNNRSLVGRLRSGDQAPVKLTINSVRLLENLAGAISKVIEPDSMRLLEQLKDPKFLTQEGYTVENVMSLFIPNTYELWWDTDFNSLIKRMKKEHQIFWEKKERLKRLEKLEMTKEEVYTLASIIEKETLVAGEKPRMAGVYMNRLKRGMKLQADPTVVFANKQFDLKRVLNKHLEFDSPYNTYVYEGLPPGPICMPNINSIDAVLNYEDHRYLYFCAKPDNSGLHDFAKSLIEHNRNAKNYWRYLNKNKIK